jgi:4-amino-4-deoxy-L-arabinose transferase-like glycosyltransferase
MRLSKYDKFAILVAVVYSLIIFFISPIQLPIVDDAGYADVAQSIFLRHSFQTNFETDVITAPGLPFLLAGAMFLFGNLFIKSFLVIISFSTIISAYLLVKELKNERIAFFSSLFMIFIPEFIWASGVLLSDVPFLPFLFMAMYFYLKTLKGGKNLSAALCGIFTGVSILIRYVGLVLPFIFLIHYLTVRHKMRVSFTQVLLFILLLLSSLAPWTLREISFGTYPGASHIERFEKSEVYGVFDIEVYSVNYPSGSIRERGIDINIKTPVEAFLTTRIFGIMILYLTPVVVIVFVVRLFKMKYSWEDKLLLLWIGIFILFHIFVPNDFSVRYILPFSLPLMVIFSEAMLEIIHRKIIIALVLGVFIISSSTLMFHDYNNRWKKADTTVYMEAGKWLKENTEETQVIYGFGVSEGAIPFYANRKYISLGDPTTTEDIMRIKKVNPEILLVGKMEPIFHRKFNETKVINQLGDYHLVKSFEDNNFYVHIYVRR